MSSQTNWQLIWLLWAAGLGAAAQYGKISVIFDRLPQIYPDAGTMLGFAVSLVGFLGIIFGVAAGVLVARIGYRTALLGALLVGALVSFLQAFWPPLPLFLGLRVIEGAAHLAIVVAAPTLIADLASPKDQGRALTLWGSFFGVAFAILVWGGLPLVDRLGMGALNFAHGAYLVVISALLFAFLPSLDRNSKTVSLSELWNAHWLIYRSARIAAPAVGWLFYTFCFVSVLTVLPPFIAKEMRAFTLGAMPLLSIISSLTIGVWMLRYLSAVSVVVIGFFLCAFAGIGLAILPGSAICALALGAALGLIQGATFAAVPQLNEQPEKRALANGGLAQMGNLGNTMGTPIMVAVIAGFGYTGLVIVLVLFLLAGGLAHVLLARSRGET